MSELLSPSQAAERMGVTVRSVYQYLSNGDLVGAYKDERGRWQIPEDAIPEEGMPVAASEAPAAATPAIEAVDVATPDAPEASETQAATEEVITEPPVEERPPSVPAQQEEALTPEERAARRERERAAALAAHYAQQELEDETPPVELSEQEPPDVGEEAAELAMRGAAEEEEGPVDEPVTILEVDQAGDLSDDAGEDIPGDERPVALDQEDPDQEAAPEDFYTLLGSEGQQEALAEPDAQESVDDGAPAEAGDAPALEARPDPVAETDGSVEPDDYVMDVAPVKAEPESESADVAGESEDVRAESAVAAGAGLAAAHAVEIDGAGEELSDVDLAAIDVAKLAAAKGEEAPADVDAEAATATAKRQGVGCPVILAIVASLLILLAAAVFIVNQSLGLFGGPDDDVAVTEPQVAEPETAGAVASEAATGETATGEPAADAAAVEPGATIQPAAEGESLVMIPAFAGADAALNAQLRDAIATQSSALGIANLRAEAEAAPVGAEQFSDAADLASRYQADVVMWGEGRGGATIVNLLSLESAAIPAAEALDDGAADGIQPLDPGPFASFVVEDASTQLAFLAGMAVGQSLMLEGDYEQATTVIQEAVDSVGPGAPPSGLDQAFFRLGWLYQTQQEDPQLALDAYTLALQLNPDHAAALNNIGIAHDDLGDKQQALFFYNRALPLLREAENTRAEVLVLNRIGALYNDIGDVQQALTFYNRALPLTMEAGDPAAEAVTRRRIALIHKDLGELDIAEEQMVKVLALDEANGLARLDQDTQALEEIQALRAEQTPPTPVFRSR